MFFALLKRPNCTNTTVVDVLAEDELDTIVGIDTPGVVGTGFRRTPIVETIKTANGNSVYIQLV